MITGATMENPIGLRVGVFASDISMLKMYFCVDVKPGPPCSTGQFGAAQPLAASRFCQVTMLSLSR